jgi:hypothetical protein
MKVDNVFFLIGNDEVGMTKSLAYMLTHNKNLLKSLMELLVLPIRIDSSLFKKIIVAVEVFSSRTRAQGRTDIEIRIGNQIYTIIEAKIGSSYPGKGQVLKYASRLKPFAGKKRLVVLTEIEAQELMRKKLLPNAKELGLKREELVYLTWDRLHQALYPNLDLNIEIHRQFEQYLEEMVLTHEILVAAATDQRDFEYFMKHRFYWFSFEPPAIKKRHSYLALYEGGKFGKKRQGIRYIAKILEYQIVPWKDLFPPSDPKYDSKDENLYCKLVLGEPIELPRKIGKSRGKRVYNWTTTFEKLLKARFTDELL